MMFNIAVSTSCTLLVDTYDTLKSGVPNAIRVFRECIRASRQFRLFPGVDGVEEEEVFGSIVGFPGETD